MEYAELFRRIKERQDSVYLFYGDEEYVKEKALALLKEQTVPEDMRAMNVLTLEGTVSGDAVCDECDTLPFFTEKKLVIVRDFAQLLNKGRGEGGAEKSEDAAQARLLAYLDNPSPHTCLVFYCAQGVDKRKKLFKALLKCTAVEFKPLEGRELSKWTEKELRAAGKAIGSETLQFLLEFTDTRLELFSRELDKLIHYAGEKKEITREMILQVVTPLREYNLFKMTDAILERRSGEALRLLGGLLADKEEPIYILAGISRQMRLALRACLLQKERGDRPSMLKSLGVPDFALQKLLRHIASWDEDKLKQGVGLCLDADEGIKTGRYQAEIILVTLVTRLCAKTE